MTDEPMNVPAAPGEPCGWCGTPLTRDELRRGPACDRCARRLKESGLSDGEIYGVTGGEQ